MTRFFLRRAAVFGAVVAMFLALGSSLWAENPDDPFAPEATDFAVWGPTLPTDALTPSAAEIARVRAWEKAAFAGERESFTPSDRVTLEVIRQDYNLLRLNESCMGNPLQIGSTDFSTGLGTHANSEIVVRFPKPVVSFSASVGIDRNITTDGRKGSVVFAIRVGEKEFYRSPVRRGGDEPESATVKFDKPISELTLLTETTEDGPSCDQCDWAEAVGTTADGTRFSLSDGAVPLLALVAIPSPSFTTANRPTTFSRPGNSSRRRKTLFTPFTVGPTR